MLPSGKTRKEIICLA